MGVVDIIVTPPEVRAQRESDRQARAAEEEAEKQLASLAKEQAKALKASQDTASDGVEEAGAEDQPPSAEEKKQVASTDSRSGWEAALDNPALTVPDKFQPEYRPIAREYDEETATANWWIQVRMGRTIPEVEANLQHALKRAMREHKTDKASVVAIMGEHTGAMELGRATYGVNSDGPSQALLVIKLIEPNIEVFEGADGKAIFDETLLDDLRLPAGEKYVKQPLVGTTTKDDFNRLGDYIVHNETDLYYSELAALLGNKKATRFKVGEVIIIKDIALFSGAVCIRRKGESTEYWTNIEITKPRYEFFSPHDVVWPKESIGEAQQSSTWGQSKPSVRVGTTREVGLQEEFMLDQVVLKVTRMRTLSQIGGPPIVARAPAGKVFVIVEHEVRNSSDSAVTHLPRLMSLRDSSSGVHTVSGSAGAALSFMDLDKGAPFQVKLEPRASATVWQGFEVPDDAAKGGGLTLVVPELGFGGGEVHVRLE